MITGSAKFANEAEFATDVNISELTVTTGQTNTKSAATHDMAAGAGDTQNVRAGSTTITLNGALANNTSITLTISSDKVLATDVLVVATDKLISYLVHTMVAGSFKATLTNKTGGTLADDSEIILNWVAL